MIPVTEHNGQPITANLVPSVTHQRQRRILNARDVARGFCGVDAAVQQVTEALSVHLHVVHTAVAKPAWVRLHDRLMEQTLAAWRNLTRKYPKRHQQTRKQEHKHHKKTSQLTMCKPTLIAPADSPHTVTRDGSPPNAAAQTLRNNARTHYSNQKRQHSRTNNTNLTNVRLHPLQCKLLVQQTHVPANRTARHITTPQQHETNKSNRTPITAVFPNSRAHSNPAQCSQTVVGRHHNNRFCTGNVGPIVHRERPLVTALRKAPAMKEHHHRQF
jgi:hypothetical protein